MRAPDRDSRTPQAREDTNQLNVDPRTFQLMQELAPGVYGYTMEHEGALYVPLLVAENPGTGQVRAYLDSLPRDRTVKFPCVISSILEAALLRRGFVPSVEWSDTHQEHVDVLVRHAP